MIARAEFYHPNLLKSSTKFTLMACLLSLTLGCGNFKKDEGESSVWRSWLYNVRLDVQNIELGKDKSSAEVKARIMTQDGKDVVAGDPAFDLTAEMHLNWKCWQWMYPEGEDSYDHELGRGKTKLTIAARTDSGTVTIDDLPGRTAITIADEDNHVEHDINCDITATGATILGETPALKELRARSDKDFDVSRIDANFEIKIAAEPKSKVSLALEIKSIVPGQSNSQVGIKLTLGRYLDEFKEVVEGDKLFDKNVDIDLQWRCGTDGNGNDKLAIPAGKASVEKTYSNFPKKQANDEVSCTVTATPDPEIEDEHGNKLSVSETFIIDELELTVIVTSSNNGKPMEYVVSEGATNLTAKVELRLSCSSAYHGLIYLQQNHSSVLYDKKISNLNSTDDGNLFAISWGPTSRTGDNCTLIASSGSGAERKRGRSARLDVSLHQNLFNLNSSGGIVTSNNSKMTHAGKFYVYPYAKPAGSERTLVGYLDVPAAGVASGTKLQESASDSTELTSLADGGYFVVYEKSASEMYVFYTKIGS